MKTLAPLPVTNSYLPSKNCLHFVCTGLGKAYLQTKLKMEQAPRETKAKCGFVEALLSLALSGNYLYSYYPAEKRCLLA